MSDHDAANSSGKLDDPSVSHRSLSRQSSLRRYSFGLLGREKEAARTVVVNSPADNHDFPDNSIRTAKYTWLTIVWKAPLEQFRRLSNFYFLIVACVTFIPDVSPSSPATAVLPLVVVVAFGLLRDVWEDLGRKRADKKSNGTIVTVLNNGVHPQNIDKHEHTRSYLERHGLDINMHAAIPRRDIHVGDIVLVKKNETFPADLVLLYSSNEAGIAYVSTANLDGESNLKRRLVPVDAKDKVNTANDLLTLKAKIEAQNPDALLHQFDANIFVENLPPGPLDENNLLLRSCVLRNTDYAYGVAVYTGEESKIALNMRNPPSKLGGIETTLNFVVVCLFSSLMLLVIISSIISGVLQGRRGGIDQQWYMDEEAEISGVRQGFRSIATYIILYHTFIPISLFVTLEFARVIQGFFMKSDLEMKSRGIACNVKANNLNDTLGTVQHILTDKTGTLTENVMRYVACSTGGKVFDIRKDPEIMRSEAAVGNGDVKRLILGMGLCHSVVPETKSPDDNEASSDSGAGSVTTEFDLDYQGQSPDEVALVSSARDFGVELRQRQLDRIKIREFSSDEVDYIQLAELEFSSDRKRMSVIYRCPDGRIRMFTKGADGIMLDLIDESSYPSTLQEHIDLFALDGLRTLVYAERELGEEEYKNWKARYEAASNLLSGRKEAQGKIAAEAEQHLQFVGATAVEDQLQDRCPETIQFLRDAGLSMWVLTGDKRETAENIGYSARLLNRDMRVIHIEVSSIEEAKAALNDIESGEEIMAEMTPSQSRELMSQSISQSQDGIINASPVDPSQSKDDQPKVRHQRTFSKRHSARFLSAKMTDVDTAIIIDGASLEHATSEELADTFVKVAEKCSTVICCRVTPLQKAKMVKLVRSIENTTTLAIGDGGNDVSMIQEAHVGVGIVGKEGAQAARAADYSISEFKHLQKLMTVHGRYAYVRTCGILNLSFYKNVFFTFTQFFFQMFAFWSGTTFHQQWMVTFFNALFTLFPPFLYGIFEKDLDESTLYKFPYVYKSNWNNRLFSVRTVAEFTLISSIWHALAAFFGVYLGIGSHIPFVDGKDGGFYFSGMACTFIVVTIVLFKFALLSHLYNAFVIGGLLFSFTILYVMPFILVHVPVFHANELEGVYQMLFRSPAFWLTYVFAVTVAFFPDFSILAYRGLRKSSSLVPRLQRWEQTKGNKRNV